MASKDVKQLSDREHCRQRVGMYLGGISEDGSENPESLVTAIREAVDNSKDVLIQGSGNTIWCFVNKKASEPLGLTKYEGKSNEFCKKWYQYIVGDNAGGIPIKRTINNAKEEITMCELAVANFRAGSKFSKTEALVGLNGIGVSATNFTSAEFIIYSHLSCHNLDETTEYVKSLVKKNKITKKNSEDWYYKLTFNLGIKVSEELVKFSDDKLLQKYFSNASDYPSTVTAFIPDPTIHGTTVADLPSDFEYLNYLHPEFNFYIDGKKVSSEIGFEYSDSIRINLADTLESEEDKKWCESEECKNPWIQFDFSIGLSETLDENERYFSVNTLDCQQGKHVKLFDMCYTQACCDYFKDWEIEKYATMGVNVLCILQCCEPSFSSQTKERLSAIQDWDNDITHYDALVKSIKKIIKKNEEYFQANYDRIVEYYNSKMNWGKMKELQKTLGEMVKSENKSSSAYMPRKLIDCANKDRQKCSVFICEGDSASGGLIKGRKGRDDIAIMGLRGKLLNVVDMDINDALENNEVYDITHICGGVDDLHVDFENTPFGKYVIATDADADGYQIASLVLALLMQNHSFLFGTKENKYFDSKVYIAVAPLYAFFGVDGDKDKIQPFYAGEEKKVAEFQKKHKYSAMKRYKGLGELNPDELARFYYDEETSKLVQVHLDDVESALSLVGYTDWKHDLMIERGVITDDTIDLTDKKVLSEIA